MLSRAPRWVAQLKNKTLPSGRRIRRVPLGVGRGTRVEIDFARDTQLFLGLYEIELARTFRRFCRRGATSFDVGGQKGYQALVMARLTRAPVLSFECDPAEVEVMNRTFAANPKLGDLVEAVEAFVGATTDPATHSLSLDDAAYDGRWFVPDVVKIDIDGAEVEALEGARRLLGERHPHVIVETHSAELERRCAELLREAGYEPTVIDQRRWLRDHRPIEHNRWLIAPGKPA